MLGIAGVGLAASAFVGSHFLLSHPWRAPLVRRMGEGAFAAVYSGVAAACMGVMAWAYVEAPPTPFLWPVGDVLWTIATALMLGAAILLAGSFVGNPATVNPTGTPLPVPGEARGVFAVTRHPMMWSFAIWGVCHVMVYPMGANIVVAVAMIVLALVGASMQDRKHAARDPAGWGSWQTRTGFVPGSAIAAGRARLGLPGAGVLVGGTVLWLVATWAHLPISGWAAGVWRWV